MKHNINFFSVLLLFVLITISCSDDDNEQTICETCCKIITDVDAYSNVDESIYSIVNASIVDDCLEVTLRSGGCNGSTWVSTMYATNGFGNQAQVSISMAIDLENNEECEAIVSRTFSYDIAHLTPSKLQTEQTNINLLGYDEVIIYE